MASRQQPARLIRAHQRRLPALHRVLSSDREWFARRPWALVRFRPERPGDFDLLTLQGHDPSVFVPSGLDPAGPLSWVAVVDVLRAIDLPAPQGDGGLRTRIRTVPIRSRRLQAEMAEVFAIAVCRDVLAGLQGVADELAA